MESLNTHAFYNGVCWYCKAYGSIAKSLQRCGGCQLVVYCGRDCQKDDRSTHKYICKEFPVVDGKNVLHTTEPWEKHIASLLKRAARLPSADAAANPLFLRPLVCNNCHDACRERLSVCRCSAVSYCSIKCSLADKRHRKGCTQLKNEIKKTSSDWNRMAYPRSLYYALILLHEDRPRLLKRTTLVVHVVTSNNMMDSMLHEDVMRYIWEEGFAHQFEKLKKLHFFFIVQDKTKPCFFLKTVMKHDATCEECEAKGLVITYSFQQMKYHMFFSSEEYTKPDIVAVYGNTQEMSVSGGDALHSQISYGNMTYNPDTLVVLLDATMDLVKQGVRAVNTAQPVEHILAPRSNPMRGFMRTPDVENEKYYFTVLRKK